MIINYLRIAIERRLEIPRRLSSWLFGKTPLAIIRTVGSKNLARVAIIMLTGGLLMMHLGGCSPSPEISKVDCPESEQATVAADQSPTPVETATSSDQQGHKDGQDPSEAENAAPDPTLSQAAGDIGESRRLDEAEALSDGRSADVEITIEAGQTYQTMEGFGATHLPLMYEGLGDVLCPSLRLEAIDAVYNQVGLNMGNLEGDLLESPGNYDQRSNDNDDPFDINLNGFQTFSADAMKEKVVDLAQPFGFDDYFLGQKINVRWASPWLNDIRKTDYDGYLDEAAEQVATGHIYWRDTYGIVPEWQMPFNEPLSGSKTLTDGTVQEVVDIIKRASGRLESEGFGVTQFVTPNEETTGQTLQTTTAILTDPQARQYVGAFGYHSYPYGSVYASIPRILSTSGAGNPDANAVAERVQLKELGKQYGLPLWMTEVSHGAVHPLSYDSFRGRAIHIHDELVYADASAYYGMLNMWDTISQQEHFGNNDLFNFDNEGNVVFIDTDTETVHISGMGYTIGHYARWIEPGAVRIEATSSDPLLQVTAFHDNSQGKIVLVLINNKDSKRYIEVNFDGISLSGELTGEQSTADAFWQPLERFEPVSPAGFKLEVPAESVTTLSFQLGELVRLFVRWL